MTIAQTPFTTSYTYRADDQIQTLTYPDGEAVTVSYNARGLAQTLLGVSNGWEGMPGPTYVSGTSYNGPGQLTSVTYGNGVSTAFSYHPQTYRLTAISVPGVLNLSYGYDAVGNLQTLTDGEQSVAFTYDALNRLRTARGGFTADYTYSVNGNLLTKKEQGGTLTTLVYPTPGQPRPHAPVSVAGVTYGYDGNGNVTSDGRRTMVYDQENRLTQVISGTVTTTFTYRCNGLSRG